MNTNLHSFLFLLGAIVVGAFAALIIWTLIVKSQVTAALSSAQSSNPLLSALGI